MGNATKRKRSSIKLKIITAEKLTFLMAVVFCVLISIVFVFMFISFYSSSRHSAEQYAIEVTRNDATFISHSLEKVSIFADTSRAMLEPMRSSDNPINAEQYFAMQKIILSYYPDIKGVRMIFDDKGGKESLYVYRNGATMTSKVDPAYLLSANYSKYSKVDTTRIFTASVNDLKPENVYVLPSYNRNGQVAGLILVELPPDYFVNLNNKVIPLGCETFIVDQSYNLIASPYPDRLPESAEIDISPGSSWGRIIGETIENGSLEYGYVYNNLIDESCILVACPINVSGGSYASFCTIIPESYIFKSLDTTRTVIVVSVFAILVLVAFFLLYGLSIRKKLYIDPLTGIYNRLYIDKKLPTVLDVCFQKNRPASLIIADIDHFKRVNDHYGHQTGDLVLKHFCQQLQYTLRRRDWIARFGGEEFIICLPFTNLENAIAVAERIRRAVESSVCFDPISGETVKITSSFGVAVTEYNQRVSMLDIIKKADENVYKAKNAGRNKVAY